MGSLRGTIRGMLGLAVLLIVGSAHAGVIVNFEDSWVDPADVNVKLNNNYDETEKDVKSNRRNTQTFTITSAMGSFTLDRFVIGYNKINTSKTFSLRILEVDAPSDGTLDPDLGDGDVLDVLVDISGLSTPSSVNAGTGANSGDVTPAVFDLTGDDEVTLVEGKYYGIELNCSDSSEAFAWAWAQNNPFADGAAYSEGGASSEDYAIALVAVPEPATMSLLAIGGLAGLLRRKR